MKKELIHSVKAVFRNPFYAVPAILISLITFSFFVWLPNIGLLAGLLVGSNIPLTAKLHLAFSLLAGIQTNFSLFSASYTIAIAILFGINMAMIVYSFKRGLVKLKQRESAATVGAAAAGLLGVGCAACGSFMLNALLSFIGAAGALAILPLGGKELGILSAFLLMASIFFLARKIDNSSTCSYKH